MIIEFIINGKPFSVCLERLPPGITLNTFLRNVVGYTGTKFMCLEGGCGACICTMTGRHPSTGKISTWAVNSCLTLLNVCADWEITTIEGLRDEKSGYNPFQKRLAKMHGTQCGYCSPGMVMNMYGLYLQNGGKLTMAEIENGFGGNLCRCTGYRPILDAMKSFAVDSVIQVPEDCGDIEDLLRICPRSGVECSRETCKRVKRAALLYDDGTEWHWPTSIDEIFSIFDTFKHKQYMLVAGNTAHGVYRRTDVIDVFIDINAVPELHEYSMSDNVLTLGGNVTLHETMKICQEVSTEKGFSYLEQVVRHLDLVANNPVRNMGTLAGNLNIKHKHPEFPSDIFILMETLDAQVVINVGPTNQKKMKLSEYLTTPMEKKIIRSIILGAYPKSSYIFETYKIMPRAQNAHAYVNAGFLIGVDERAQVNSARICFGGISPNYVHAKDVETLIVGKYLFDPAVIAQTFSRLEKSIQPDQSLLDPSPKYRRVLACGLYYKFLLTYAPIDRVDARFRSGAPILKRPISFGTQVYDTNKNSYPVTQPVEKIEALIQCSGEAKYMNDLPPQPNQVWCAFVQAKKVGASIEKIDAADALKIPGVISFYSAKDIPGANAFVDKSFDFVDNEEIFCKDVVKYYDQPLGVIAALTSATANMAANKVKVMYSRGADVVLPSMLDVLEAKQLSRIRRVVDPSVDFSKITDTGDIQASGIFDLGLQYHFTMEPQTTVVMPLEKGLQVHCATQCMDSTQFVIAKMLQMKITDVQIRVPRLGGGYGSKISRGNQIACSAALVASKLNCPARFVQTIESMMGCLGKRWACHSEYEFDVKSNGKIVKLRNKFCEDAGWSANESPVAGMSTACAKNCYEFNNNYELIGEEAITDAPSHTWCRAPGSVEGISMIENIMDHIAFETKRDPVDVRLVNLVAGNKMESLLPRFIETTDYKIRRRNIDCFNKRNRWRKKGLGLAIMEYPLLYFGNYPATVSIYHGDGSVAISHGGIEMGQGMNTKVAQVAAYTLGIPLGLVRIVASDTLNGANSAITGGSVGSESVCYAVRKSCNILLERLKPVRAELKNATWQEVVQAAYIKKINLISSECYKEGEMENYSIFACALTEVVVDILTGNNMICRVDILEDTGASLNPSIDVGQVEGAFVMSLGYFLTEHLIYNRPTGELLTNRTWTYKIPGCKDIPIEFNIELLLGGANSGGFMCSKASGEPPLTLGCSAILAIRQAVQAARDDAGEVKKFIPFSAPTTPEDIVLNAGTKVLNFTLK